LAEESISAWSKQATAMYELIFNATHDGMIAIESNCKITFFNKKAETLTGYRREAVLGQHIKNVIPASKLEVVLQTRNLETNHEIVLQNNKRVIATNIPLINESGFLEGALMTFKELAEIHKIAEKITDLKEIHTMLEGIILSSNDAISVVDENGIGILINPAYTRITGLREEDVIGKPANTDISEGDSMHMQVLKTRRPVRGAHLKVGPQKKEVVVNVAPIIVEGRLKGSIAVIHDMSEILQLTSELNRARHIIRTLESKDSFEDIIGCSEELKVAVEQAKLAAKTSATVLLRGESGTGKELFAHAIHNESDRKFNKFIKVNCESYSETLLEMELFGFEESDFHGARGIKQGLLEQANNGSIFLDEISALSESTQVKLVGVLQESKFVRIGGQEPIPINVRVIAATKQNLEKAIAGGSFQEDLYYRINRMAIHLPPLRLRKSDIPYLTKRLLAKINQDYGRHVKGITQEAVTYLKDYDWPGNIRELENILGRAVIFMKPNETLIEGKHLQSIIVCNEDVLDNIPKSSPNDQTLSQMVEQYEAKVILQTLIKYKGNKTLTAKSLGISLRSLYYKLEKYKISDDF